MGFLERFCELLKESSDYPLWADSTDSLPMLVFVILSSSFEGVDELHDTKRDMSSSKWWALKVCNIDSRKAFVCGHKLTTYGLDGG